jgi:hypothetical protein
MEIFEEGLSEFSQVSAVVVYKEGQSKRTFFALDKSDLVGIFRKNCVF